jgi:hypothetical protein
MILEDYIINQTFENNFAKFVNHIRYPKPSHPDDIITHINIIEV